MGRKSGWIGPNADDSLVDGVAKMVGGSHACGNLILTFIFLSEMRASSIGNKR